MNNKVVYANEATITSTRTGTEVVAEIDNFRFEQYLDAFIATNKIPMRWNGKTYVGNVSGMEFTTDGPKESIKYTRR